MTNYRKTCGLVRALATSGLMTLCWSFLITPAYGGNLRNFPADVGENSESNVNNVAAKDSGYEAADKDAANNVAIKAAKTSAATKPKEDLPNFHEVHPFLYRGGEPTEKGLEELKQMGVSTLIDLRAPSERKSDEPAQAKKLGLKYINLVMDSHAPTEQQVDTMMRTIDDAKKAEDAGEKCVAEMLGESHGGDCNECK